MVVSFVVNGEARTVEADADTPLLWVLRENLGLTGTKFGCGIAVCGSCTVHIDGAAVRACAVPVSAVEGAAITTIEGLAGKDSPHAVQAAWIANQVPQCGYCQSGMIMAVSALLARTATPTDVEIEAQITNICRCGTYERVRRAIRSLAPAGEVSHG